MKINTFAQIRAAFRSNLFIAIHAIGTLMVAALLSFGRIAPTSDLAILKAFTCFFLSLFAFMLMTALLMKAGNKRFGLFSFMY